MGSQWWRQEKERIGIFLSMNAIVSTAIQSSNAHEVVVFLFLLIAVNFVTSAARCNFLFGVEHLKNWEIWKLLSSLYR